MHQSWRADPAPMQIPNADVAKVAHAKVVDYLLNPQHPEGASKAAFFTSLGFEAQGWETLANALRYIAQVNDVVSHFETIHGTKYIIEGELRGPRGDRAFVRTVWIVDEGETTPRLVTAYPCGQS